MRNQLVIALYALLAGACLFVTMTTHDVTVSYLTKALSVVLLLVVIKHIREGSVSHRH